MYKTDLVGLSSGQSSGLKSIAWITLLVAVLAGPWVAPGYIFGTDFAGPRHYTLPDGPASYAGLQLALGTAAAALPADIVGKMFILSVLVATGLSAFWTVPMGSFVPRAVASLVYLFNPFVYDRLAYGQLTVLAGYAILPLVALVTRRLLIDPSAFRALVAGGLLALVGIVDVHMALIAVALVIFQSLAHLCITRANWRRLIRIGESVTLAGAFAALISAYWLVPVLAGNGPQARTLSQIGSGDLSAFNTVPDSYWGLLPNVLGLYGFWAERTGRFTSMKEFAPIWPVALVALLAVAVIGAVYTWRRETALSPLRPWVAGLLLSGAVAVILDIGASDSHVAGLITWLDATFPQYRGMRDANKWAALLALAYSQMAALGAQTLMRWAADVPKSRALRWAGMPVLVSSLLATPLYYGNGLLYGMHGQVQSSQYPAGWYAADRALVADPHPGRAVFLPWHGYMAFSFVRNANQVVASPAPMFFSIPVIASRDLEIPGIPPPFDDPDQAVLAQLVAAGADGDWARTLASHNVKYVLVAREDGWQRYAYLDTQRDLVLVADHGSILIYRNVLWDASSQ